MRNPWTKRNPFLSMWLSGVNKAASVARGQVAAEANKQRANLTRDTSRIWSNSWFPAAKPKSKRKR